MKPETKIKLLVIGGSAGSLSMVLKLIPLFTQKLSVPVIIIFHRKQTEDTLLLDLMSTRTTYEVKEVEDKDTLMNRVIYLAPADYHVLIEKDYTIALDTSEKINFSRPSIDVTFESAAEVYGASVACMLLSGANADGVKGMQAAQKLGSTIIVQDPASAEVPFMPQQAVANLNVDFLLDESKFDELFELLAKTS